jgi:hypothetical protein
VAVAGIYGAWYLGKTAKEYYIMLKITSKLNRKLKV